MLSKLAVLAVSALALTAPAMADLVTVLDPTLVGSMPGTALDLFSNPGVTEITGSLDTNNTDFVAMFALDITAPQFFTAYTVLPAAHGIPDTELFLFNSSGQGVYMNDDKAGADQLSCLPSANAVVNPCSSSSSFGPVTPGLYYLAVTISQNTPVDDLSTNNPMFSPLLSTDVAGPTGTGVIKGWDGGFFTSPNFDELAYDIIISQAPEPAAWPVMAAACAALIVFRRKLRARS